MQKSKRYVKVGHEARTELADALAKTSEAVGSTLGPGGAPFGFDKLGQDMRPVVSFTKDGLTVLKALGAFTEGKRSAQAAEEAVLNYCKQAAAQSVLASGDGTTSTIVLANAVCGQLRYANTKNVQALARRIEREANAVIEAIKAEVITGDEVARKVALTSTNGDEELTSVVMDAVRSSGAFGTHYVEKDPSSAVRYRVERQDGYSNCSGYNYNQYFAISADQPSASASRPIIWERPYVALFNGHLLQLSQLQPILAAWNERLKTDGPSKLVIVTYEVGEEVCNHLMVLNRQLAAQGAAAFVVKTRLTAETNSGMQILFDIAACCGISDKHIIDGGNLKTIDKSFFGTCPKVQIRPSVTMFLGRADEHWVERRVQQNQAIIDEARSPFDREITGLRNAELAEGLVKIRVGGGLVSELQERADRFDDAAKAVQACMRAGALPGCGVSYIRGAKLAEVGSELMEALRVIHNTIMGNFGGTPVDAPGAGWTCCIEGETTLMGDALQLGVLDAAETVYAVIRNGVALGLSIAQMGGYSYRDTTQETSEYE